MGIQERKEREKRARQEAILKAAQKIFLTKGLDQATIDDVAEKAELSKGTIYLYFKSKEELYLSVFLKGLDVLMGQFHAMRIQLPSARADELIQEVKEIYYRFFKEYPEYFYINSLLYHGRIKDKINPYIWAMTHQKTKKCLMVFADIIQKGITDGIFRNVDTWKTANSFWGAATGVMMLLEDEEHRKYIGIPIKELLDYTTNMLLEGLKVREL
ncbi:MAG: TetR/AcrR family transcriptional regulator [Candidatus Vecturithrix sp.]|jgi:AcrR family transcriptional regulator|nr:TetR/AcrR family transcriptional regulator [Candidatus Vecturithrix sp.]